jgi:hypothetical protein
MNTRAAEPWMSEREAHLAEPRRIKYARELQCHTGQQRERERFFTVRGALETDIYTGDIEPYFLFDFSKPHGSLERWSCL